MKETVNFLFVIDVSGSMYGQKIASVNASLAECIAELKQIVYSGRYDIKVLLEQQLKDLFLILLKELSMQQMRQLLQQRFRQRQRL